MKFRNDSMIANMHVTYQHIKPGDDPPKRRLSSPFRAVVIVEADVTARLRGLVSDWLVASGCFYMMAWGRDCSRWDDAVDDANLELFSYDEIPDDKYVETTWHEAEPLAEVFWFAKNCANHDVVDIRETVLLHISEISNEVNMLREFAKA